MLNQICIIRQWVIIPFHCSCYLIQILKIQFVQNCSHHLLNFHLSEICKSLNSRHYMNLKLADYQNVTFNEFPQLNVSEIHISCAEKIKACMKRIVFWYCSFDFRICVMVRLTPKNTLFVCFVLFCELYTKK